MPRPWNELNIKAWTVEMLSIVLLSACAGTGPFISGNEEEKAGGPLGPDQVAQRILLVGDAGAPSANETEPVLAMTQEIIRQDTNTIVVFLGDNIYPSGLSEIGVQTRKEEERRLNEQVQAGNHRHEHTYFIPGNHDWKQGKEGGWESNDRQEVFVDSAFGYNSFLPDGGCPGPEVEKVGEDIALIMINTQWWLHKGQRPEGDAGGCEDVKDEEEFLVQLEAAIKDNRERQIIVLGHHPLMSSGNHGGYYTWKDHLFPLTAISPSLYIPLPIVGSIYPGYRRYMGNVQDLAHPKYRALIAGIEEILEKYQGAVYASGHEHNLQFARKNGYNHIVSGSGSKVTKVAKTRSTEFAYANKGLCELLTTTDREVWARFRVPDSLNKQGEVVFETLLGRLNDPIDAGPSAGEMGKSLSDSVVTAVAAEVYEASWTKRLLMGAQYRDVWAAPVEFPVLDLYNEKGGLTPIKRGGGMATKSLRFAGGDGYQYVVRSIQKDPSSVLPSYLRNTVARGLIQDGIAAAHPYSAITVPPMADAIGVLHTDPKIVYVPNDPALGEHRETFGDLLSLFEKRPSGDQSEDPHFGNAEKLVSTPDMIEDLHEDHYNQVDEEALLVARLFDNILGDWDRHDDQWRWARYPTDKGRRFVPVPRDRDQVFHKFEGWVPDLVNSSWGARNLRNFDYEIDNIVGQNFNARYLDRSFLTRMDRRDFIQAAQHIQNNLTDEVVHQAISLFPDTVYALTGEEIEAKLRSRRDKLVDQAQDYYEVLAKEVDIVGSELDEHFEVVRLNDDETSVNVFPVQDGKVVRSDTLYSRTFFRKETKEVRLYGIGGNDKFHISGEVKKGMLVRIIGGVGSSKVDATDRVKGWRKRTWVYSAGNKLRNDNLEFELASKEAKDLSNNETLDASYDRKSFVYNTTMPIVSLGYNPDDGVFLGGGVLHTDHGFMKEPFSSRYSIAGKAAMLTGSWDFKFTSTHTDVLGRWDLSNELTVQAPNFLFNFYGLGNESVRDINQPDNFYRFELDQVSFFPSLQHSWDQASHFRVGPTYQYFDPRRNRERFSNQSDAITQDIFDIRQFLGIKAEYQMYNADNSMVPHRGVGFNGELAYVKGITVQETEYLKAKAEFKMYTPLEFLPDGVVLALRVGASHLIGDYEVYQASTIGGYKEFRGVRRDRYAGRTAVYANSDLRVRLFRVGNNFVPFDIGGLAHFDLGRVWQNNEDSFLIHHSYGFGGWIGILDLIAIQGTWSKSDDDELFVFGLGFFF